MSIVESESLMSKKDFIGYIYLGLIYGIVFLVADYWNADSLLSFVKKAPTPLFVISMFLIIIYSGYKKVPYNFLKLFIRQTFIATLLLLCMILVFDFYFYFWNKESLIKIKDTIENGFFKNASLDGFMLLQIFLQLGFVYVLYLFMVRKKYYIKSIKQ